jgi:hypothetical protein
MRYLYAQQAEESFYYQRQATSKHRGKLLKASHSQLQARDGREALRQRPRQKLLEGLGLDSEGGRPHPVLNSCRCPSLESFRKSKLRREVNPWPPHHWQNASFRVTDSPFSDPSQWLKFPISGKVLATIDFFTIHPRVTSAFLQPLSSMASIFTIFRAVSLDNHKSIARSRKNFLQRRSAAFSSKQSMLERSFIELYSGPQPSPASSSPRHSPGPYAQDTQRQQPGFYSLFARNSKRQCLPSRKTTTAAP